jgi:asparagine synthetase A
MSIIFENNQVNFSAVVYEDEVIPLRDFLQEKAGQEIQFNFKECNDIHLAVMQLIMAYKKNYLCQFEFGDEKKLFETVLKGFDTSEDYCN